MRSKMRSTAIQSAAIGIIALLGPLAAHADSAASGWQWDATLYVWLPSLSGDTAFPPDGGGPSIAVSGDAILDSLNFAFMGAFGARNGPWGFTTDIVYLDLGAQKNGTRDFSLGQIELPASVDADLQYDLTGWLWTTMGSYTVVDSDRVLLDVLAGARMLDLEQRLGWTFNGDISSLPLPGRSGTSTTAPTQWDAIVGVKGRVTLGADGSWFLPYLLDVGTGDSDLTWQAMAGVGYRFDAVELKGVWRYLDYDLGNHTPVESLSFSGPAIGITYRF